MPLSNFGKTPPRHKQHRFASVKSDGSVSDVAKLQLERHVNDNPSL